MIDALVVAAIVMAAVACAVPAHRASARFVDWAFDTLRPAGGYRPGAPLTVAEQDTAKYLIGSVVFPAPSTWEMPQ